MRVIHNANLLLFSIILFSTIGCRQKIEDSNQVINSFYILDENIIQSNTTLDYRTDELIMKFYDISNPTAITPEIKNRIKISIKQIDKARDLGNKMVTKLYGYKEDIISCSGGLLGEHTSIKNGANTKSASKIMISNGKGKQMKKELLELKINLAILIDTLPEIMKWTHSKKSFYEVLPILLDSSNTDNNHNSWELQTFQGIPAIASLAIIDKYINDVKMSIMFILEELIARTWPESICKGRLAQLQQQHKLKGICRLSEKKRRCI